MISSALLMVVTIQAGGAALGQARRMDGAVETLLEDGEINFVHLLFGELVIDADYDAIGMEKIADGGAFAEKFGVGRHAKLRGAIAAVDAQLALELLASLRGDGAFFDDQFRAAGFGADEAGYAIDGAEIGIAVGERRSADADENCVCGGNGFGWVAFEAQAIRGAIARDDAFEAGLVNGEMAGLEDFDFREIAIGADDIVADFREAAACYQTYVARADDRDFQSGVLPFDELMAMPAETRTILD